MDSIEVVKGAVAEKAFSDLYSVVDGSRVLGLGTGSTIKYFIDLLIRDGLLSGKVVAASSIDTLLYIRSRVDVAVADIMSVDSIDVYIDGADEVSSRLDLVKGRGAAFSREKALALRSRLRIYLVDYRKYTGQPYLYSKPIPIEVSPHYLPWILGELEVNGLFKPRIRWAKAKDGPVISDNGNIIIDLEPLKPIMEPEHIDRELKSISGVIDTGIFPRRLVDKVYVGYPDKILSLSRR